MKPFPVAGREMRVASRRAGTYWVRFVAASVAIGTLGFVLMASANLRPADQGQILFVTLASIGFAFCLLSGILTTADCVSEERRDGTLGLLFLTHLRGYDVVIGKLVANSIRSICIVVAILPVIALPLLMGGVSGRVVWMAVLVLGNTLFFSLAIGVFVSSLTRDARQSIGGAVGMLVFWLAMLPLTRVVWIEYVVRPRFTGTPGELAATMQWTLDVNPVYVFVRILEASMRGGVVWTDIWMGLGAQHGIAWILMGIACLVLPRSWRDRTESSAEASEKGRKRGDPSRPWRNELLDWHPFAWIAARDRRSGLVTWLGLAAVAGVWTWGFLEVKEEWLAGLVGLWTTFFAGLWIKLRVAAIACRHLHEHRRSGALELVLSTPLTPDSVVRGNLLGIRHSVLPALTTVIAGAALLWVASMGQEQAWSDRSEVPMTFGVGLGLLIMDSVTLAWSGMWRGLASARYVRAYATTVGMVLFLPWVVFVVSVIATSVLCDALNLGSSLDFGYPTMLAWWAAISVGINAWQWLQARAGLATQFRELAAEPYGTIRMPTPRAS